MLLERVERARELGAGKHLDEIIEISDNKTEDANSRKVRIYAREKYAAMIAPQRYGAKLDVTSAGKALPAPVTHNDNRIQALLTIAAERMAQRALPTTVDVTPIDPLEDVMT